MSVSPFAPRQLRRLSMAACCAAALVLVSPARAQSEASAAPSALAVASVVGSAEVAGAASGAVVALPVALAISGAQLVVKGIKASGQVTVLVLERVSDAAQASVELSSEVVRASALAVGTAVSTTVIASGVILSAAGEALCFIPNEIGRTLLHNERVR